MTTCLGKSCSFGLLWVPFVNCCRFMYLVISLLVLRAGCGIWLYQFLIIAYLFIFPPLIELGHKMLSHLWHQKLTLPLTSQIKGTSDTKILSQTPFHFHWQKFYPTANTKILPTYDTKIWSNPLHLQPFAPKLYLTCNTRPQSHIWHQNHSSWYQTFIPPLTPKFHQAFMTIYLMPFGTKVIFHLWHQNFIPLQSQNLVWSHLGPAYNGTCPVQMGHVNSTPIWPLKNHYVKQITLRMFVPPKQILRNKMFYNHMVKYMCIVKMTLKVYTI